MRLLSDSIEDFIKTLMEMCIRDRECIRLELRGVSRPMKVVIPYAQGGLLAKIHRDGQVLSEEYAADGIEVCAMADEQLFGQLAAQLGEHAVVWQD